MLWPQQSDAVFTLMWHLFEPPIDWGRDSFVCSWQPSCVWPLWNRIHCIAKFYRESVDRLVMLDYLHAHRSHKCPGKSVRRKNNNNNKISTNTQIVSYRIFNRLNHLHYLCILVDSFYNFDRFRHQFWIRISSPLYPRHRNPFLCAQLSESIW